MSSDVTLTSGNKKIRNANEMNRIIISLSNTEMIYPKQAYSINILCIKNIQMNIAENHLFLSVILSNVTKLQNE